MRVESLGSSSKGNAYLVIADGGQKLLVDDGLVWKELKRRLESAGLNLEGIIGILITHSHTDHVHGIRVLLKHIDVPLYANQMTAEAVSVQEGIDEEAFVCFENGQPFAAEAFTVHPFSIPHDTSDPVGYLVKADGMTYFHGTDIGTPLDSIGLKLAEADIATLESNHDPVMLRKSGRPPSLIQRIAGPRGHLSNDEAAGLVRRFASPRLKSLSLAHLSQDCNAPHLAEATMRSALSAIGRADISLTVLAP